MMGRDSAGDITRYGLVPWIFGVLLAVFLIWIMCHYALPIGG